MVSVQLRYKLAVGDCGGNSIGILVGIFELSWVISMISGIGGRLVSIRTLFIACMIHPCRVVPWPAVGLSVTKVWTAYVAHNSSSIPIFIMSQ